MTKTDTENRIPRWKRAALTMEPTKGPSSAANLPAPDLSLPDWFLRLVKEGQAHWLRENPW